MNEKRTEKTGDKGALSRMLLETLEKQILVYHEYEILLSFQERAIANEDDESLSEYSLLEQASIKRIYSCQKVLDSLLGMYRMVFPQDGEDVAALLRSIAVMKEKVVRKNGENRTLLKDRMGELQVRLADIRVPPSVRSVYGSHEAPFLIDITR